MKATGIVRRIDDLGRIVIPKEIRNTMRWREGDPLEIFVDRSGEVILKKYSPIGTLDDFAKEYADAIYEATGHIVLIADRDNIIAVAGAPKMKYINKPISVGVERVMEGRRAVRIGGASNKFCKECAPEAGCEFIGEVIAPIIADGEAVGAVIICTTEPGMVIGDIEVRLAETAAGFLAKQVQQ